MFEVFYFRKTAYGNQQEDQFAAGLGIAVNVKAQPDVLQVCH